MVEVRGEQGKRGRVMRRRLRASLLVAAAALSGAVIAPQVSSAFSRADVFRVSLAARGGLGSFTPASVDPRLLARFAGHDFARGPLFRFTPAGSDTRPDRSVTVAVRVGKDAAQIVSVRGGIAGQSLAEPGASPVRIAPVAFNLGVSRGYQNFANDKPAAPLVPALSGESGNYRLHADVPSQQQQVADAPARFAPRVEMDERDSAGRTPRTIQDQGDYKVDVGGSYRVTRNVAVTAGLRYSTEHDRIRPLTDSTKDNQAIYVGTQFRF